MEELPLSGLLPDDPQNRLSKTARQRVVRARIECDRIRWEAQANVDARQLSDAKARYVLNQANLKGLQLVQACAQRLTSILISAVATYFGEWHTWPLD